MGYASPLCRLNHHMKISETFQFVTITKTFLYNFDPLINPHFYIVKLGFTGYTLYNISYFSQKHRLWYSLEPPHQGSSNKHPQSMFWAEIWKISESFIWKFFGGKTLNRHIFVMTENKWKEGKVCCSWNRLGKASNFIHTRDVRNELLISMWRLQISS